MAVSLNCCIVYIILCVWQFNLVLSVGVNLPFTSMTYKATPINPKSLSLSLSTNENVEAKLMNKPEAINFKSMKPPLAIVEEEQSKNTKSLSKLLCNLGLISDNNITMKDFNFSKQKHNIDPNILYEVVSAPHKNEPNFMRFDNEKSDIAKDLQDKKNAVNYNIKVISPPAVFNSLPLSLPSTQNVADNNLKTAKLLSETNKYSINSPETSLSNPVRVRTEESKQESTTEFQNVRQSLNNGDETKIKTEKLLAQKSIINNAEHDLQQIRNIMKNEDMVVTQKNNEKLDLNINRTSFKLDTPLNNSQQIPLNFLDTSYIKNQEISPIVPNYINNIQEIRPVVSTHKHKYNVSTFNNIKDKEILSNSLLSYASQQPFISDISPTLQTSSTPILPEISKPQTCANDYDTYNLNIISSLDNIISFLRSKFDFAPSDISATNSTLIPATDEPFKFSSDPEIEAPKHSLKPNGDISIKDTDNATKKSLKKVPVPYISSVTINYMPCIESSNEIVIIV